MAASFMPEDDDDLQDYLRKYVGQNLKRSEILDFVKRDYPQYPCSLPTLDRRLRLFGVRYINYDTKLEVVKEAVQKELAGPGKLLGVVDRRNYTPDLHFTLRIKVKISEYAPILTFSNYA